MAWKRDMKSFKKVIFFGKRRQWLLLKKFPDPTKRLGLQAEVQLQPVPRLFAAQGLPRRGHEHGERNPDLSWQRLFNIHFETFAIMLLSRICLHWTESNLAKASAPIFLFTIARITNL